jgi:hypothetical protein
VFHAVQINRIEFRDNALGKKERPRLDRGPSLPVRGSWSRRCSELDGRKALAISACRLNYLIRVPTKKRPRRSSGSGPKFASFGRMGDDPRPLMSEAWGCDSVSIFCEVTASTEMLSSHTAKAPAPKTSAFAFVPHTRRFLGRQSLGCRTGKHGVPHLPAGNSVQLKKHIPVGPQLKRQSRLGFHTNCNNVADL